MALGREARKVAGEPLPRRARSMAPVREGSRRVQARRRRRADRDRVSKLKVDLRATSGTRKPQRRGRFTRLMGPLRRSREDSTGIRLSRAFSRHNCRGLLLAFVVLRFLCAVSRSGLSFHVRPIFCLTSQYPRIIRLFFFSLLIHISVHSSCTFIVNNSVQNRVFVQLAAVSLVRVF